MKSALRWLPALALLTAGVAHAQAWPTKTVRLIVPVSAGGTTDILARLIGQALAQATGQPFVVELKPGASGSIAAAELLRSEPDGHTLLVGTSSTHAVAPAMGVQLPYNTVTDFTPLALLAESNNLLLVSPTLGVNSMAELLALAKQRPGYLNYSSAGVGSFGHLSFELFKSQAGIFITHIPYKGTSASITDLASGAVHLALDAVPSALPHATAGRVRGIAVSGSQRSSLAPNIPTIAESGVPGFVVLSWFGLYGPKGMPPALAQRINAEVAKVLQSPEMGNRFRAMGIDPGKGSPAQFGAMVAADRDRWTQLVRDRNIKPE